MRRKRKKRRKGKKLNLEAKFRRFKAKVALNNINDAKLLIKFIGVIFVNKII